MDQQDAAAPPTDTDTDTDTDTKKEKPREVKAKANESTGNSNSNGNCKKTKKAAKNCKSQDEGEDGDRDRDTNKSTVVDVNVDIDIDTDICADSDNADNADLPPEMSVRGMQALVSNPHQVPLPSSLVPMGAQGQYFSSAEESQLALTPSDADHSKDREQFPQGFTDINGQQVDLRRENSWTLRLHQVSTAELAEVMSINLMAPTILNARLKGLMERTSE